MLSVSSLQSAAQSPLEPVTIALCCGTIVNHLAYLSIIPRNMAISVTLGKFKNATYGLLTIPIPSVIKQIVAPNLPLYLISFAKAFWFQPTSFLRDRISS